MRHPPSPGSAVLACVKDAASLHRASFDAHAPRWHTADLLAEAHDHQVMPYVDRVLRGVGTTPADAHPITTRLRHSAAVTAVNQLRALADLRWVTDTLAAGGWPWFVMKGPVLAERVYPDPCLRPSRDLDVIVPAKGFAAVIDVLEANGAKLLDANWDLAIGERRSQLHVRLPYGTTMDLHWHLVNSGRVRDTLAVSMPTVWGDLRRVAVGDLQVDTLSVTGTVVHLGLHAALGGAWRLRWLNDLKLVIAHEGVDWVAVATRAYDWRVCRLVGVALLRSARLLHADVPDEVLTDLLGGPRYRAAVEALDRAWPPIRSAPARLWPQLARDSWANVPRALAWRVRQRARNGVRGFAHGRRQPEMMMPSGGDHGRSRYMQLVERGELDQVRS